MAYFFIFGKTRFICYNKNTPEYKKVDYLSWMLYTYCEISNYL
ncbi:MAG: hypothetical protein BWY48_00324 [Parcubacteria group bacterium ADurb.Bin305]|nr:MAG: hypothetical protein BWY48_00324 [Parcubacteria group bacterium ADurb.Bin305]